MTSCACVKGGERRSKKCKLCKMTKDQEDHRKNIAACIDPSTTNSSLSSPRSFHTAYIFWGMWPTTCICIYSASTRYTCIVTIYMHVCILKVFSSN